MAAGKCITRELGRGEGEPSFSGSVCLAGNDQERSLAARLKAVVALGEVSNNGAAIALEDVIARDPSSNVREEAKRVLGCLSGQEGHGESPGIDRTFAHVSKARKRGISIALTLLDETLCEVEQWADGREIQSVFHRDHNALSSVQRQEMLSETAEMRDLLRELQETPGLDPAIEVSQPASRCRGRHP